MLKTRNFDSYCCTIIVLVTSFTNMKVEAFPQRHLNDVYNAKNIMNNDSDSNDMKTSFFNWSQQNNTKWIIPRYNFSHNNNKVFCRNQQVIRVPVNRLSNITTIPCFTQYGGSFRNDKEILLYKGSPETHLTLISGNDMQQHRILEYTDFGFRYNFSGDWAENGLEVLDRWRYTCFFANSNAVNYVTVELYRNDNSAVVNSKNCDPVYHANDTGMFFCQIPGNINATDFKWAYRTEDGNDEVFYPKGRGKKKYSYMGIVGEDIRVKLPYSNITGIVCRVNKSYSNITFQGLQHISVTDIGAPIVLDNETVKFDDEPGLQLNCSFKVDNSQSTFVHWLQDGSQLNSTSQHITWSTPISRTTITGLTSTYTSTNYTCVVKNHLGFSSKSFIVTRRSHHLHPIYIYALAAIVPVFLLAIIIACVEWKRRKNAVMTDYKKILKALKEKDPANSSSINFVKDIRKWEFLGRGVYGEVWKTEIIHPNSGEKLEVAVKTFTWPPFLSIKDVKLRFDDLINEIRICQELSGSRNIVRYEGFYAPEVHSFNVYLILDYCDPGQLKNFMYQHNQNDTFIDDIDMIEQTRIRTLQGNENLKTSHLMKWAQQIAKAMTILHDKNIVHRDLAARNILLKKLGVRNNESIDDVNAQLADFGMSRFLRTCSDSYIIQEDIPKERNFPVFWYPPESIGFDSKVEYTKKSDVWSFGVLLWEMFSRGSDPNLSYEFEGDIKADNVKQELLNGRRLAQEYLYNTPEEIWLLMKRCWSLNPDDRPDFSVISETLKDINTSFGLYNNKVPSTAECSDQEVSNATVDDNLRVANVTGLHETTNISEATNQCAVVVDAIELENIGIAVPNATKLNNLKVTIASATDYFNQGTSVENEKLNDAGNVYSEQQEQSTPNQSMQNSDEVRSNMMKNNATSRNTYMQHDLQTVE